MRIERFEVEGHRGIRRIAWSPADLTVLRGDGVEALAEAVFTLSHAPRGWSDLAAYIDGLALPPTATPEGAEPATTRWRLTCAGDPGADDPRGAEYELGIYPPGDGLPWEVRYEFLRRLDEFSDVEVLRREGAGTEYVLTPPKRATPGRPKSWRESVARDMSVLGTHRQLFEDPAVKPFAQPLALWSRYRRFDASAGAAARAPSLFPSYDERLVEGGGNLINALQNLVDLAHTRPRLEALLRAAVPGHEALSFALCDDGTVSLSHTVAGRRTPVQELPDETLRALCVIAAVLSTAPPPLVWFDGDVWDLPEATFPAVAEALVTLSARAQVVLAHPPDALEGALADALSLARPPAPQGGRAWRMERAAVRVGDDGITLQPERSDGSV